MKTHPLTQLQVRRGMRLSIFDGMLAQAFYGLTWPGSVFVTGFALLLGAGSFTIGLLAALPPLLSGVNLLAAWALERVGRRRRFFAATSGIHRSVILLFMVIPFAAGTASRPALLWLLIGVIFVSVFFGAFQHTAWMSWMADMIPEDRRGAFFSRRNMLCGGLWMVQSYAIGQLLTRQNTELTYALVFAAATLLAVPSILLVTAQPEPPLETDPDRPSLIDLWRHAWNLKQFRWFLFFQLAWGFTTSLAGPFYNVYMLQNLGIPIGQITAWGVV